MLLPMESYQKELSAEKMIMKIEQGLTELSPDYMCQMVRYRTFNCNYYTAIHSTYHTSLERHFKYLFNNVSRKLSGAILMS